MKRIIAALLIGLASLGAAPRSEGYLPVSQLHSIYYATFGNPEGIPVVVLHGGPGAGCTEAMTRFFDLDQWFVVMFDQRGAMRSIPFGCIQENTSQDLVRDIEKLRKHLGIERWAVFGGSWGSTLAMLYGETYPKSCLGFVLRGVFLARPQDEEHLYSGMSRFFPEAYEPVLNHIPESERDQMMLAYARRVLDPDPEVALPAAQIFMRYDMTASTYAPNPVEVEEIVENEQLTISMARLAWHYMLNESFLEPNQLLKQMHRVAHLPCIIVQGRWDAICPPDMAYAVHKHWPGSQLWIVPDGGHASMEPPLAAQLAKATATLAQQLRSQP
jgi:proline iminopeptidase